MEKLRVCCVGVNLFICPTSHNDSFAYEFKDMTSPTIGYPLWVEFSYYIVMSRLCYVNVVT